MMDMLKPCPFCGAVAERDPAYDHAIRCSECDMMAGSYTCDAGAIAAWNRRADLPPTLEAALALPEIAALVEAAKIMRAGYLADDDRTVNGFWALDGALTAIA